jgi:NADH-quinone oxidoreductase subunit J
MNSALIGFWIAAAASVITAFGVILHRNPVRSALFLIVNFLCLAVLYLLLNAQVMAMFQVLVYAGAIMVLFLFVIMLLNLGGESAGTTDPLVGQRFVGALLGIALLVGIGYGIKGAAGIVDENGPGIARIQQAQGEGISQIQIIGWDLFTRYVYPFELTSILLLVGVVGVIILTRRRAGAVTPDA